MQREINEEMLRNKEVGLVLFLLLKSSETVDSNTEKEYWTNVKIRLSSSSFHIRADLVMNGSTKLNAAAADDDNDYHRYYFRLSFFLHS